MSSEKHHVISYKTYIIILLFLLTFTLLSVAVTHINLGAFTVTAALIFAVLKSSLVLSYFMHLKFESKLYTVMVLGVIVVFLIMISITFFDYLYR